MFHQIPLVLNKWKYCLAINFEKKGDTFRKEFWLAGTKQRTFTISTINGSTPGSCRGRVFGFIFFFIKMRLLQLIALVSISFEYIQSCCFPSVFEVTKINTIIAEENSTNQVKMYHDNACTKARISVICRLCNYSCSFTRKIKILYEIFSGKDLL